MWSIRPAEMLNYRILNRVLKKPTEGTEIKKNMLKARRNLIFLAVFAVAVIWGFIGESSALESSDQATNEFLVKEMARVIKVLEPVRKPETSIHASDDSRGTPAFARSVVERDLIKSLPNGQWQWNKQITRAEGLFYFARLLEKLSDELVLYPVLISVEPDFDDIPAAHWLFESLKLLAGTGSLNGFGTRRLNPDAPMSFTEVKRVGSSIVEYLGSNCLLVVFDGKSGSIRAKGTTRQLEVSGWNYSFNRKNWYAVDPKGNFIPDFRTANVQNIYFMNENYVQTGSYELREGVASAGMIKIQKKYRAAEPSPQNRTAASADAKENLVKGREALRNRLKELGMPERKIEPVRYDRKDVAVTLSEVNQTDASSQPGAAISQMSSSEQPVRLDEGRTTPENTSEICEEPAVDQRKNFANEAYEGAVLDAVTGNPVKGASVLIATKQLTTDENGRFSFTSVADEVLDVTVYSEGYEALSLRHRTGYRSGPLKLSLRPVLTNVSGKILHSESAASLGKVLVKIGTRATRTDAEGNFIFKGVKPGYHQLSCFARGFMEAHEIIHVGNGPVNDLAVKLRPVFDEYASGM